MQVNDGGIWKNTTPHARDGGVWKPAQEVWVKYAGVWKKEWQNAFFTITASGISSASNGTTYRGWSTASSTSAGYFDMITGDAVAPLAVEPGATIMSAYIVTTSSNLSYINLDIADTRGPATKPGVDTLGWKSVKSCTINGVVTVQGGWVNRSDVKTGQAFGSGFVAVDAQGVPMPFTNIGLTQEQLAAILAAAPAPNTLTFAFS